MQRRFRSIHSFHNIQSFCSIHSIHRLEVPGCDSPGPLVPFPPSRAAIPIVPPSMPESVVHVVDVYPYRLVGEAPEFVLLRRASGTDYAGEWRMVGGKIQPGEAAWEAALRELREETQQTPEHFWTLPSLNRFYEWQHDRVNLIPAFAAELSGDPVLNAEHDDFAWLPFDAATDRLAWPEQQRLLRLTARLLHEGIPPSLVIEL